MAEQNSYTGPIATQLANTDPNNPEIVMEEEVETSNPPRLIFPEGLLTPKSEVNGPFVKISAFEYDRKVKSVAKTQKMFEIFLPLPPNLIQEYTGDFSSFDGSLAGDVASAAVGGGMAGAVASAAGSAATEGAMNAASKYANSKVPGAAKLLTVLFDEKNRKQSSAIAGIALNPRFEIAFNSMKIREHHYEFILVPVSAAESETIETIVSRLRLAIHPSSSDSAFQVFLKYPYNFVISFHDNFGRTLSSIPFIPDCFMKTFNTTFVTHRFNENNSPVATRLTMTFTESIALTRDDIKNLEKKTSSMDVR